MGRTIYLTALANVTTSTRRDARLAQCRRSGRNRGPARIHVVDEHDDPRRLAGCLEHSADIPPALGERQASLRSDAVGSSEQRHDRELPADAELIGEALGRVVAAAEAPIRVGRDERQRVRVRPRHDLADELGRRAPRASQTALLPGGDEQARCFVVGDRGPRARERDASSCALAAALDGPRGGGAAALTARLPEPVEGGAARVAQRPRRPAADDTAPRQDEIQQHRRHRRLSFVTRLR